MNTFQLEFAINFYQKQSRLIGVSIFDETVESEYVKEGRELCAQILKQQEESKLIDANEIMK